MRFFIVFNIFVFISNHKAYAIQPFEIDTFESDINFSSALETLIDESNSLSINDLLEIKEDQFQSLKLNKLNFGFVKHPVWAHAQFKLLQKSGNSLESNTFIYFSSPLLDTVNLFLFENGKKIQEEKITRLLPLNDRAIQSRFSVFKVSLKKESKYDLYIQILSDKPITFSTHLASDKIFYEAETRDQFIQGLYFGAIIALAIYNLFIYFSTKNKVYLFYVLTIFFQHLLTQLSFNGLMYQYLLPQYPLIATTINPYLVALSGVTFSLFAFVFLDFKTVQRNTLKFYSPENLFKFMPYFGLLVIVVFSWLPIQMFAKISALYTFTTCLACIFAGIYALRKKVPTAKIYLISWSFLLTGTIVTVLALTNVISMIPGVKYSMQIGSLIESLLLSFALANRIKSLTFKLQQEKILSNFKSQKARLEELGLVAIRLGDKLNTPLNIILLALEAIEDYCKENNQNYDLSDAFKFSRQIEFQIKKMKSELEQLEKFKSYLPEHSISNIENLFEDAEKKI